MRMVDEGKIAHIVIPKLDRAWRSAVDCLDTLEVWNAKEIQCHLLDLGGNTLNLSTPIGRFFLTIAAAFAELERSLVGERTKNALAQKIRGGYRAGTLPYGYRRDFDAPGRPCVPHPTEQAICARIYQLRSPTPRKTWNEIAAQLTAEGWHPRAGPHAQWSRQTLAAIFRRLSKDRDEATKALGFLRNLRS